jgi:hypothetical protein
MPRVYGYVRPYPGRLGKQVRDFVEEQGFVLGPGMVVAAGATDIYASRWIMRATMDLLVLPFHLHRGDGGRVLDAIGVLMSLPEDVDLGGLTVLMPVRAFSWGSSFQRRLELLRDTRPGLAAQILIAHQDEIGSPTLASRLRRAFARPPSTTPLVRSASVAPPTMRDVPAFQSPPPPAFPSFPAEDPASAQWEISRERAVSGMQMRNKVFEGEGAVEEITVYESQTQIPSQRPAGLVDDSLRSSSAPPSSNAERASLILPKGQEEPSAARESFRRAAEIGAKARQDAGRKKGK